MQSNISQQGQWGFSNIELEFGLSCSFSEEVARVRLPNSLISRLLILLQVALMLMPSLQETLVYKQPCFSTKFIILVSGTVRLSSSLFPKSSILEVGEESMTSCTQYRVASVKVSRSESEYATMIKSESE